MCTLGGFTAGFQGLKAFFQVYYWVSLPLNAGSPRPEKMAAVRISPAGRHHEMRQQLWCVLMLILLLLEDTRHVKVEDGSASPPQI